MKPARGGSPYGRRSEFDQNYFLFLLSRIKGLGPRHIMELLKEKGGLGQIYKLAATTATGRDKKIKLIAQHSADDNFVQSCQEKFSQITDQYLIITDALYPPLLKNIYDPPLFLYYRGQTEILKSAYLLTIVGSRTISSYHQNMLRQIMAGLAQTPLVIVSGLAYGIDGYSHRLALENNLPTIAVLGSGVSAPDVYPAAHRKLAEEIIDKGGLIISEYPQGTAIQPYNFPKRNRLLAGLSKATLVISGAEKSGTLITAQVALEEGREVLALPGNANVALSWGPNHLIKNGAGVVTTAEDILRLYNLNKNNINKEDPLLSDPLENKVYQKIKLEALTPEELAQKLQWPLPVVQSVLTQLELKNLSKTNLYNQVEII